MSLHSSGSQHAAATETLTKPGTWSLSSADRASGLYQLSMGSKMVSKGDSIGLFFFFYSVNFQLQNAQSIDSLHASNTVVLFSTV